MVVKQPGLILLALALVLGAALLWMSGGEEGQVLVEVPSAGEPGGGDLAELPGTEQDVGESVVAVLGDMDRLAARARKAGEIGGRVLDELSEPLVGMRVLLYRVEDVRWMGRDAPLVADEVSDSEGSFRMKGLALGSFAVRVSGEGWAPGGEEVFLRGGQSKQLGLVLRMRRGQRLSGVVVDSNGMAVVGAWIVARWTRTWSGEMAWPEVRSDGEGSFSFSGLPVGVVHVLAWSEGRMLGLEEWIVGQPGLLRVVLPEEGPYGLGYRFADQDTSDGSRPRDLDLKIHLVDENGTLPLPSPIGRIRMPLAGILDCVGLRAGRYEFSLRSREVALIFSSWESVLSRETPQRDFKIAWSPLVSLTGRLLLSPTEPAPGILLQVWNEVGPTSDIVMTDKEGKFVFPKHFGSGDYPLVSIETPGYLFRRGNANYTDRLIQVGLEASDYRLRRTPVFSGHVVDQDKRPVSAAEVWMNPMGSIGRRHGMTLTDAAGAFRISRRTGYRSASGYFLSGPESKPLFLHARHDAADGRHPIGLRGRAPEARVGLVLQLVEGGVVEGMVLDEEGAGIAGASVIATLPPAVSTGKASRDEEWGKEIPWPTVQRWAFSDPEGRFRIRGLRAGTWKLHAAFPGRYRRDSVLDVQIQTGERKQGLELVLTKGLVIEGRLVSEEGRPMAGARIRARASVGPDAVEEVNSIGARTAEDGGFVLRGLRESEYLLQAELGRHLQEELGLLRPNTDGRSAMRSGRPYETRMMPHRHEEGRAPDGHRVSLWKIKVPRFGGLKIRMPMMGTPLHRVQLEFLDRDEHWTFSVKAVKGVLSLDRLLAGSYDLTIRSHYCEGLHRKVVVRSGEIVQLEILEVVPHSQREWRIVDRRGIGLEGVWVGVDPSLQRLWPKYDSSLGLEPFEGRVLAKSDAEGRLHLPNRVNGMIYAFKPGFGPRSFSADRGHQEDIVLELAGELRVQAAPSTKNRYSYWWAKLKRFDGRKHKRRRRSSWPDDFDLRLHPGKPLRILGLKPGRYLLEAADFSKVALYPTKSIPGRSYLQEIQIDLGDNGLIRLP